MTCLSAGLFDPDADSGVALRSYVGTSLASSFEHIFEACAPHLKLDTQRCNALVERLRSGSRELPWLFSLHFRLVEEISRDRLDRATAIITSLAGLDEAQSGVSVLCLGEDTFPMGEDIALDYFRGEQRKIRFDPVPKVDAASMRANLAEAIEYLRKVSPGLAGELEEMITTIFVVRGVAVLQEDAEHLDFEGSSALRAFGGIVCNTKTDRIVAANALVLVHEHAHNVLFALSPEQGVVTNADDELFSSPLRIDPRPMEGIFHATFVLARMIYWLELVCGSHLVASEDVAYAKMMLTDLTPRYHEGVETIARHAKLTEQGRIALEQADQFMASRAA
jgi:hypothetical protein